MAEECLQLMKAKEDDQEKLMRLLEIKIQIHCPILVEEKATSLTSKI